MCDAHARGLDRRSLFLAGAGVSAAAAVAPIAVTRSATAAGPTAYRFSGHFNALAPDWHYLSFDVPEGVRSIAVTYDHGSTDTGLGFSANVIDIGMFDPSGHDLGNAAGFRGWSGGARDSFRVATDSATPGYLAGPITPGEWSVILGPVAILPPGVDWTVDVTLELGEATPAPAAVPPPRSVDSTGEGWYRGDLHLHTEHSDGRHTQASLVALARDAGLDFIGSSEHNTSSASLSWGEYVDASRPPLVLCGEEITTRNGHWIAAGVPAGTWVDWRYRDAPTLGRFTEQVRGLGGLSIACHPWVPIPGTRWGFGYGFRQMDAVEIWNGPWTPDDEVGVAAWHAQLATGRFVPIVGNSDSHRPDQVVGQAQTVVRAPTLSVPAIVDGLRAGRSWLAESSDVDLTFEATVRDRTVTCGESLDARSGEQVAVRLEVSGAPGCVAQILGQAAPLAGALTDAAGNATVTATVPAALTTFVRAEVRRLDGKVEVNPLVGVPALAMVAMTNPLRLRGAWANR